MKRFGIRATALALAVLIGLAPAASASVALGDDLHSGTVELAPGTEPAGLLEQLPLRPAPGELSGLLPD